eukprot:SAG11_NODE_1449_length_4885_cov_4.394066_4_plen_168_part_00
MFAVHLHRCICGASAVHLLSGLYCIIASACTCAARAVSAPMPSARHARWSFIRTDAQIQAEEELTNAVSSPTWHVPLGVRSFRRVIEGLADVHGARAKYDFCAIAIQTLAAAVCCCLIADNVDRMPRRAAARRRGGDGGGRECRAAQAAHTFELHAVGDTASAQSRA